MLTDRAIAALKPKAEEYRVTDARGLFLMVTPTGLKVWRTIYTRAGKRHLVKLGQYPEMSLTEARLARAMLRRDVAQGADPAVQAAASRRLEHEANSRTVEAMARAWHARMARRWADSYAAQVMQRLEAHVFPRIGTMPVATVRRRDIVELLEAAAERSGAHQANNTRQHLSCFYDDLLMRDAVEANPAIRLDKLIEAPATERQPAVVTIEEAREVLAKLEASQCSLMLKLMHRFTALTGLRPSEVREAQWSEIQGDVWRIPAARMKGRRDRKVPHSVFLPPGALEVLAVARSLARPSAVYVFPSDWFGGRRHQPYDRASLTRQLTLALGPRIHVAHGWRAAMATILTVRHPEARDLVQVMLAHQIQGQVARLYNRSDEVMYEPRIRPLAHEWADLLLEGAPSAWQLAGLPEPASNVVPMIGRAA